MSKGWSLGHRDGVDPIILAFIDIETAARY
jgi:hypothetical protein